MANNLKVNDPKKSRKEHLDNADHEFVPRNRQHQFRREMVPAPDHVHPTTGYHEPPNRPTRIPRQRRTTPPTTITDIRIARIETVAMTADQEAEAIAALAVLLARYWRDHPDQAA
jgi:hypothetical protein